MNSDTSVSLCLYDCAERKNTGRQKYQNEKHREGGEEEILTLRAGLRQDVSA